MRDWLSELLRRFCWSGVELLWTRNWKDAVPHSPRNAKCAGGYSATPPFHATLHGILLETSHPFHMTTKTNGTVSATNL